MAYEPTQELLIADAQAYLDMDPRYFLETEGCFTWWGKVVLFFKTDDEVTLEYEGESITFSRP